jgi:molybdopterin/thiamine biosynthesis adenylyltransferase
VLSKNELIRYSRQLKIPEFREESQKRLKESHVVIVGMGGLGCASAIYLTAAGVGRITLIDFDVVELSDLNRQILYWEEEIGERKVFVAQRKLARLNPQVEIIPVLAAVREDNISQLMTGTQVVLDGLDNFATRLIVNSACVRHKVPFIHGGVCRFRGLVTTIIPGKTSCLACFYRKGSSQGGGFGVLGVIPAVVANMQALEAIKLITGCGPSLAGKLFRFNGKDMKFQIDELQRNENCRVCSPRFQK